MKQKEHTPPTKALTPILFAGTGSDVGKSVIAAAFCRIFLQDGYRPAPFKAQNMALNSYATSDGLEIGRAQAVQAEAAGVAPHTDMNPLLLKPCTDQQAQVVLNGRVLGNKSAFELFNTDDRQSLRQAVCDAFDRLSLRYNPIVLEGAGSISEINLRAVDLVNLPMAIHAGAAVILVADIDRGGVFASVYGSILLLTEEERPYVKGILINKFRGDLRLFEQGVRQLEELCGIPVVGVVPYYKDIYIEQEDSVMLQTKNRGAVSDKVNVAVVLLHHLSNFTDFNVLERDPRVHLYYTNNPEEISKADVVILPGTKSTLCDLYELRRNGVAQSIVEAHHQGATVLGICGGYQLMGMEVCDPLHLEGTIDRLPGLGLLPVTTTMEGEKVTRQVSFHFGQGSTLCRGYEIHMGRTTPFVVSSTQTSASPAEATLPLPGPLNHILASTSESTTLIPEGCLLTPRCMGTYIHGILDNSEVIESLLSPFADRLANPQPFDMFAFKEEQYNKLAAHVRAHVDMQKIYSML